MPGQPQPAKARRCAIYCRISSDDDGDELGVKRQERNCRDAVTRTGGTVVAIYIDNDRSASFGSKPRPEFERLVADLKAGTIDVLVCQNQDRLTRDSVELEYLMRLLRAQGHDHYLTASSGRIGISTTNDRLGYRVKGLFDVAYSEFISEKAREHQRDMAERGLPGSGGKRAFGWSCHTPRTRLDTCTTKGCKHDYGMSLVPGEAAGLRAVTALLLAGDTLQGACDLLTDSGLRTVTGTAWSPTVLKQMLLSPRMAGKRTRAGDTPVDAKWPAVLDTETHAQLVAELSERYRPQARARTHLLSGAVACGRCGRKLGAQMVTRRGVRRVRYWCRPGRGGCGQLVVTVGDRLEALVVDTVGGWLNDPNLADDITAILHGDDDEIRAVNATIKELETHLARLARERVELDLELFEYKEQRAPFKQRLDESRARLAALRRRQAAARPLDRVTVEELAGAWPSMAVDVKRQVVSLLAAVLEVEPAKPGKKGWDPDRVRIVPLWEI